MPVQTRSQTRRLETFVKLTHPDGINNGFQFKEGLNEDIYELDRDEECGKGGLYFCRFKDVGKWVSNYGQDALIWEVKIPEGEEVIQYESKLKAKRLILCKPKKAFEDYQICKLAVQENGYALKYVREQTEEICKLAVQENGYALNYVKEQTPEICKIAVQEYGSALKYLKEQTPELCKIALQQYGLALEFIKEQTPELCKLAVQQDGLALEFVKEQTPEICKLAVQLHGRALQFVKEQTEEICKLAVRKNIRTLCYVKPKFRYLFQ